MGKARPPHAVRRALLPPFSAVGRSEVPTRNNLNASDTRALCTYLRFIYLTAVLQLPLYIYMSSAYGSADFWQARYRRDASEHEWFNNVSSLAPLLSSALPSAAAAAASGRAASALVIGCGTSALSQWLRREAGWPQVTSVDWAPAAVSAQASRHAGDAGLRWLVADACGPLPLAAASQQVVLDKGCMDSVLCGEAAHARAAALLAEVHRVLAPGGVFVCVSHAPPEARLGFFGQAPPPPAGAAAAPAGAAAAAAAPRWALTVHALAKPTIGGVPGDGDESHYIYVAKRA
jgi:SAM-dependent methyltransferase